MTVRCFRTNAAGDGDGSYGDGARIMLMVRKWYNDDRTRCEKVI